MYCQEQQEQLLNDYIYMQQHKEEKNAKRKIRKFQSSG